MTRIRRAIRDLGTVAVLAVLMGSVYFLPPDTSLAELRRSGLLRACVPPSYPPLVTGDPERPGIDVELLGAIASDIGVRLELSRVSAMGHSFNPRSWGVNRARCQMLAGGVVDSPRTRSFLDVVAPHAATGWAVIVPGAPDPDAPLRGERVGVLVAVSGLDRLALSRYLRDRGATAVLVSTAKELASGLSGGRFRSAVTEALLARQIAAAHGWSSERLDGPLQSRAIVFGLWKGDLTLKRAVRSAYRRLEAAGRVRGIRQRYLGAGASMTPSD